MSVLNILFAVLVLGVLGLVFGAILAISGKVFAVEKDDRIEKILEQLPGANCGGCGYAGCNAYAEALLEGNAEITACSASSEEKLKNIASLLGVEVKKNIHLTALVRCNGGNRSKKKYNYKGLMDCAAALKVAGGPLECEYGCLGMGSCVNACAFGAIVINENGVAQVNHDLCTGCLKCIEACPRNIIVAVPYTADVNVVCASHEKGAKLKNICEIGCLGCKICVKTCEYGAIEVEDNLAVIDYSKCTGCGKCAEKCPRHLIVNSKLLDIEDATEEDAAKIAVIAADKSRENSAE